MKDIQGVDLVPGDRVGVGFGYDNKGYLRIGRIHEIDNDKVKVRWEPDDKVSPWITYWRANRWIKL